MDEEERGFCMGKGGPRLKMYGIAEVKTAYWLAVEDVLRNTHPTDPGYNFLLGRMAGFERSLSCLGISNREIGEIRSACKKAEQEKEASGEYPYGDNVKKT